MIPVVGALPQRGGEGAARGGWAPQGVGAGTDETAAEGATPPQGWDPEPGGVVVAVVGSPDHGAGALEVVDDPQAGLVAPRVGGAPQLGWAGWLLPHGEAVGPGVVLVVDPQPVGVGFGFGAPPHAPDGFPQDMGS